MHRKAVEKLLKETAYAYKATELPMVVLAVIAALWTVLALANHYPRDMALQVGAGLYLFAGIGAWSRVVAAKRLNEALYLFAVVEHLGELPLTETGLADWPRAIEKFRQRRHVLPDKLYLSIQRFLHRCEFNFVRLFFLRPDWCVVL